jgi:hypothetical protein
MKVVIATPVHRDTTTKFTFSLAQMIIATLKERPEIDMDARTASFTDLAEARTICLHLALESGATHILWADADHSFPPDSLLKLLERDLPFVGANYMRRHEPYAPTATGLDGKLVVSSKQKPPIEEVESIGLGFALMQMAMLDGLTYPLFAREFEGEKVSEDVFLCRKLRAHGRKVHVDHELSMRVGHLTEAVLRFPD